MKIQMVDLKGQYSKIQQEVDFAVSKVLREANYINGPEVMSFQKNLAKYLNVKHVIPCANGTDALQIAMMSLDLSVGDEVIVPSFTYVATAEVIALLRLTPVMVDVDPLNFNINFSDIENAITKKTKAIVPVHLFGQCVDMDPILELAKEKKIYLIEDAAQAIGAEYTLKTGIVKKAGTIGDIGCTSFFPSKNLGCYGDGGAIFTNNSELAKKIQMISNHGQEEKYVHKLIGVNSRLDNLQASILDIKLKYLDEYSKLRLMAANRYDELLSGLKGIQTPARSNYSTHVYHQYTLIIKDGKRDLLKRHLEAFGIPAMIYYPIPLNNQHAFKKIGKVHSTLKVTNRLCESVLSLPMHTELTDDQQIYIAETIKAFFN